jgi:uncharacterized protein YjbI with pentapeptide repeats
MKPSWEKVLLYAFVIIVVGLLVWFLIEPLLVNNSGFEDKTTWDRLELVGIPVVLALGAFYLERSERKNERELAKDRQEDASLQTYFDRMSELLLKENLQTTKKKSVRNVARTRTLSVLRGLDANRKKDLLLFLYEAKLINNKDAIIKLSGADFNCASLQDVILQEVCLDDVNMRGANLKYAYLDHASMKGAKLQGAQLHSAYLIGVELYRAELQDADLKYSMFSWAKNVFSSGFANVTLAKSSLNSANLNHADLRYAILVDVDLSYAILTGADLTGANLENADLTDAKLTGANLRKAILTGSKVTKDQLAQAKSLKGAIMPDGTKHE